MVMMAMVECPWQHLPQYVGLAAATSLRCRGARAVVGGEGVELETATVIHHDDTDHDADSTRLVPLLLLLLLTTTATTTTIITTTTTTTATASKTTTTSCTSFGAGDQIIIHIITIANNKSRITVPSASSSSSSPSSSPSSPSGVHLRPEPFGHLVSHHDRQRRRAENQGITHLQ